MALDCDTCLQLWAEYALAFRIPRKNRTPEIILSEIEAHEAAVHQHKRNVIEI